ncbi:nickel transporter [Alsobacter sp. KACC 23698]|uniref:Nickel/cobalt efflux system n=1 Tax=Alsobacter sp. KACC 23698 TaxID=3149229 RepID=A0AAU7JDB9_9HYPH
MSSVVAQGRGGLPARRRRVLLGAAIALAALALVGLAGAALSWAMGGLAAAPPPRSPFGVGVREGGGSATGLVGWILATQGGFYQQLTAAIREMKQHGAAGWTLAGLSFAYGVFHAAGPGHGKAVISAWILANEQALKRGLAMAFAAAALQALVAIALVSVLSGILRVTALRMTGVTSAVEIASFAAVALVGAALTWRKSQRLAARIAPDGAVHSHAPGEACGPDCGHAHLPGPERTSGGWREAAGAVLAAGLRPCSGAIIVLVFAMAQGLFAAGVGAVVAMGLGTALTTSALAALAVFAKGAALRAAAGRGQAGEWIAGGLEVLASAFVFALGLALVLGLAGGGAG